MTDLFDDVRKFHQKFGLPTYPDTGPPRLLPADEQLFRLGFLYEELAELQRAWNANDLVEVADALVDLAVVALGTAHLMGLPFNELWSEVQRANLSKERASSAADPRSKRGHRLDVVKPIGFRPPDHRPVLRAVGWDES